MVNWTPKNKLQWNSHRNSYIFIQENLFEIFMKLRPFCLGLNVLKCGKAIVDNLATNAVSPSFPTITHCGHWDLLTPYGVTVPCRKTTAGYTFALLHTKNHTDTKNSHDANFDVRNIFIPRWHRRHHEEVMRWIPFPRYWHFVRGFHQTSVRSFDWL